MEGLIFAHHFLLIFIPPSDAAYQLFVPLAVIARRTAVTINTVHLSSLPRYPLGITVDYTANGVGQISR